VPDANKLPVVRLDQTFRYHHSQQNKFQVPEPTIDDYKWLVSDASLTFLDDAAAANGSLVALTKRLRKALSHERTHLVLELVELRQRARAKFVQPDEMFFTRKLLEQSTDAWIAGYKASRFPKDHSIADLCCGIGGDSLALARRGTCLAVDRDAIAALLVAANGRVLGIRGIRSEAIDVRSIVNELDCSAWHIDPDRRVAAQRTSQAVYSEPSFDVIQALLQQVGSGAMKLAPGAELDHGWCDGVPLEREWIGSRRECRQQVVWFGALATRPGQRTATIVDRNDGCHSFSGEPDLEVDVSAARRYLYAPDSTLLASQLSGALAEQLQLQATGYGASYFTSDALRESELMEVFEVRELLNLDVRRLKKLLREQSIGTLEIKVRGVDVDPIVLRKKLQPKGDAIATLLIFRSGSETKVAVAERV
jgi:THUMP domain-like